MKKTIVVILCFLLTGCLSLQYTRHVFNHKTIIHIEPFSELYIHTEDETEKLFSTYINNRIKEQLPAFFPDRLIKLSDSPENCTQKIFITLNSFNWYEETEQSETNITSKDKNNNDVIQTITTERDVLYMFYTYKIDFSDENNNQLSLVNSGSVNVDLRRRQWVKYDKYADFGDFVSNLLSNAINNVVYAAFGTYNVNLSDQRDITGVKVPLYNDIFKNVLGSIAAVLPEYKGIFLNLFTIDYTIDNYIRQNINASNRTDIIDHLLDLVEMRPVDQKIKIYFNISKLYKIDGNDEMSDKYYNIAMSFNPDRAILNEIIFIF